MKQIQTLIAYDKNTNDILFATGIVEMDTPVQVILPRTVLTQNDIVNMSQWRQDKWKREEGQEYFNFGESEAKYCERELDNVVITLKTISIADKFFEL